MGHNMFTIAKTHNLIAIVMSHNIGPEYVVTVWGKNIVSKYGNINGHHNE